VWDEAAEAATASLPPQDEALEATMDLVRELAEAGRRIRVEADRRQRLPCREGWIVAGPDLATFHDLLEEELNVEAISAEPDLDRFQRVVLAPNFRSLAPKARQSVNDIANAIKNAEDPDALLASIEAGTCSIEGVDIALEDIEVRRAEREGFAAMTLDRGDAQVSLVLDMALTPELLSRGMARDVTRRVQARRKAMDLEMEATIALEVWTKDAPDLAEADRTWIADETRAAQAVFHPEGEAAPDDAEAFTVDGATVHIRVVEV
jgi:isoleucyl-tRNA synthetase